MKLKTLLYCLLTLALMFVLRPDEAVCGEATMPLSEYTCLEAADDDRSAPQYVGHLQMHSPRVGSRLRRQSDSQQPFFAGGLPLSGVRMSATVKSGRCCVSPVTPARKLALFCVRLI